jgi:hypothetical protein
MYFQAQKGDFYATHSMGAKKAASMHYVSELWEQAQDLKFGSILSTNVLSMLTQALSMGY